VHPLRNLDWWSPVELITVVTDYGIGYGQSRVGAGKASVTMVVVLNVCVSEGSLNSGSVGS
jgi:hypothetical protein